MDGVYHPPKMTILGPDEAILTLDRTWSSIAQYAKSFPAHADIGALGVLMGIWAFETNWGREMWNHNWAATPKRHGDNYDFTTRTNRMNVHGAVFTVREDIRAYHSCTDGALGFLLSLSLPPYGSVWQTLKAGDAQETVRQLQEMRYFGSRNSENRAYYVATVADKIRHEHPTRPDFTPKDSRSPEEQAEFNERERQRVLHLVAMSLWSMMDDG